MRSVPVQAGNMPRSSLKTRKLGDPALIGGLLNREKTAFRRDTLRLGAPWSKHVRCPKALPLSMVFRLQQTIATEACEIRCDWKALLQTRLWALRAPAITQASSTMALLST